jgi:hypothetical protein
MGNWCFTRLTNAFSKKIENHEHSLAIQFMHYNFCRKHSTIKTTPACASGVAENQLTLANALKWWTPILKLGWKRNFSV